MVTLFVFVVSHIVITVWWASRVTTLLVLVQKELDQIVGELRTGRQVYFTRDEAVRERTVAEKEHDAMWRRIDELKASLG